MSRPLFFLLGILSELGLITYIFKRSKKMITDNALKVFQVKLAENRIVLAQDPDFQWPSLFEVV